MDKIDYTAHAVVHGTKPGDIRGGKVAEGQLRKMIALALEHIGKGYIGVMIDVVGRDGPSWQADKIKEVAERDDYRAATREG